jgi:uncharacterized membrane protein SpoIIM required for sporulation
MLTRFERARILDQQRHMRQALVALTGSEPGAGQENRFALLFRVLVLFELLAAALYRLRAEEAPGRLRQATEELVASAARDLLGWQAEKRQRAPEATLSYRYRRAWRDNFALFLYTLAMFVVAAVVGWKVGTSDDAYAAVLIPQALMERIVDQQKWFAEIQKAPWLYGLGIASNNIQVAISCFTLGALAGLGGVYILLYNGLLFGAVLGFCQANHFGQALLNFVVGHGVLELTIIVAAAFSGFLFGRVFYMRPYRLFPLRMAAAVRDAGVLLLGLLPWLVVAACLEVFVSPWPLFDTHSKILIGLLTAAAFWLWTWWPLPQARSESRSRA